MTSIEAELENLKDSDYDKERGSAFDWVDWPPNSYLDGDEVTHFPERFWASDMKRMLERDGQAQAVLTALTMPLRMANTTIEKPEKDRGQTDFVTQALYTASWEGGMRTPLNTVIAQMTRAVAMRMSFHEKVITKNEDGRAVYADLAWRPAESCLLTRKRDGGRIVGFKQYADPEDRPPQADADPNGDYVMIPARRALVYIHGQHVDPLYGNSDLYVARWAHEQKMKAMTLWARFADRQSMPKTVAYGKDPAQANANAKAIARLGSAGVVGVQRQNPEDKGFDVLDQTGAGAAAGVFKQLVDYLDGMMSRSVMASWMDLPSAASGGTGSYALSADQSGIFMQGRFAVAKELADCITGDIIAPLVRWNFGPKATVPRFTFEKIDADQTAKMLEFVMAAMGKPGGPQLPVEFFHLLVERVAQFLDLDDEKVRRILEEAPKEPAPAAGMDPNAAVPEAGPGAPAEAPVDPAETPLSTDQQKLSGMLDKALAATTPART